MPNEAPPDATDYYYCRQWRKDGSRKPSYDLRAATRALNSAANRRSAPLLPSPSGR